MKWPWVESVNRVLRDRLEASGWSMTQAECMAYFVGKTVREERAEIEARARCFVTWPRAWFVNRRVIWVRRRPPAGVLLGIARSSP
jgi:hypothetical protein